MEIRYNRKENVQELKGASNKKTKLILKQDFELNVFTDAS